MRPIATVAVWALAIGVGLSAGVAYAAAAHSSVLLLAAIPTSVFLARLWVKWAREFLQDFDA